MKQFVVMCSSPTEGVKLYGPYPSEDAAKRFGKSLLLPSHRWSVHPMWSKP